MQYLLAAWREEEAMYRIRTLPGEDENSELFVDLVQEEQFEGKEQETKEC